MTDSPRPADHSRNEVTSGTGRPLLASLRPLRYPNFTMLWTASLISNIGSWMQTVAVGALVVSKTGSATWAVLVAAGAFLPIGLISPIGGVLADRWPRRPVLMGGNLVAAATAIVIAALVAAGRDTPLTLLGLVTVQGAASALTSPFRQAILPDLVPQSQFLAASSLSSAQFNLGRIVGPAAAGAAIAVLGYPAAFIANGVSFLAIVAVLPFIRLSPPQGGQSRLLDSLRSGLTAMRQEPACRAAIGTIAVVAFIAAPFIALVPVMARHIAGDSAKAVAEATALLTTAQGIGAVAGALALAPLALRFGRGRVLSASLMLLPVTLLGYSASQTRLWGAVSLFFVGLVYLSVLSGLSTVVQLRAPQEFRGRVLSLFLVALGVAYPIGSLIQGPLIDLAGIGWTTAATAVVLSLVMALAALRWPGVARALRDDEPTVTAAHAATTSADAVRAGRQSSARGRAAREPACPGGAPARPGHDWLTTNAKSLPDGPE